MTYAKRWVFGCRAKPTERSKGFGNIAVQGDGRFKKTSEFISPVNENYIAEANIEAIKVGIVLLEQVEAAELDEMWSFGNQRWLWLAIDHDTRKIPAYTQAKRQGVKEAKSPPPCPFVITTFHTDDWGSYERNLDPQ